MVLKLKTSEFKILTRSHTPPHPPSSCDDLTCIALSLRERVGLGSAVSGYRLVGVGLSNFSRILNRSSLQRQYSSIWRESRINRKHHQTLDTVVDVIRRVRYQLHVIAAVAPRV